MQILIFLFSFCIVSICSECSRRQTQINEGTRKCCYYDTKGIPTIGSGLNLQREDAASILEEYNLRLIDVLNDCKRSTRKACLTDWMGALIFNVIYSKEAYMCARRFANGMPPSVRAAVSDVAFSVGCSNLDKFVNMKAALQKKDWQTASMELNRSKWCIDVKTTRCGLAVACIASGK
jgi:GH24 family phage-related lysozyme (muramidase)